MRTRLAATHTKAKATTAHRESERERKKSITKIKTTCDDTKKQLALIVVALLCSSSVAHRSEKREQKLV